jgi:hypothetical protein
VLRLSAVATRVIARTFESRPTGRWRRGTDTLAPMDEVATVQCPYCFETVELWVDPGTSGTYVEDCEVCCRPWRVTAWREADGTLHVAVDRAQ